MKAHGLWTRCLVVLVLTWSMPASATMRGTLTLDDGRVMKLVVGQLIRRGSQNVTVTDARVRCRGDACFAPRGHYGYTLPVPTEVGIGFFDRYPINDTTVGCVTQARVRPRCHIHEVVTCTIRTGPKPTDLEVVATGTLDLKKMTSTCRRRRQQARE